MKKRIGTTTNKDPVKSCVLDSLYVRMARFFYSAHFAAAHEANLYFGHEWDQGVSVGFAVFDDRTPVHVCTDSGRVLNGEFAT